MADEKIRFKQSAFSDLHGGYESMRSIDRKNTRTVATRATYRHIESIPLKRAHSGAVAGLRL